jgi:hypothetical protein
MQGRTHTRRLSYPARAAALFVLIGGSISLVAATPTPVPSPAATSTPPPIPTATTYVPPTPTRTAVPTQVIPPTPVIVYVPSGPVIPAYIPYIPPPPPPTATPPDILRFRLPPTATVTPVTFGFASPATATAVPPQAQAPVATATGWRSSSQASSSAATTSYVAPTTSQARNANIPVVDSSAADAVPTNTAVPRLVLANPTKVPRVVPTAVAKVQATPIARPLGSGSAGGGVQPTKSKGMSQMLMVFGLAAVAAGGSWGFYFFLKPPKD